ncbi:MAG TPA: DNA polymerase III subunit delta [Candidatus Polarisedimenticolaceae bacterium]|nr:DNA polymerase III subunit delta [Candidatus Polarisedimenticolaceae bacterium]
MAFSRAHPGPWGGAVLRRLETDLASGWRPGLTVLTGDDLYHLDRAQAALLAKLVPDPADAFALSILGDTPVSAGALVGAARSSGMFASRRVVFLRDVSGLEGDPEPLVAYAAKPPEASFLLVRAPKLDRKRKLHKALAESGRLLEFRRAAGDVEMRAVADTITAMGREAGVALEPDALALVLDVCGADLHRAAGEIEKMASFLGGASTALDATTARALVAGSGLLEDWELADAVTARRPEDAAAAARRLLDAGGEPIRALGGLASRARALLRAKALREGGMAPKDVVDASRAWYFRDALADGLTRYSLAELRAMPAKLYRADRALKSSGIDKGAVLEALVSDLTGAKSR